MSGDLKTKKAYFFDLYALADGQRAIVEPIDWPSVMEPLKTGSLKDLTVGDFVFQPDVIDGVAVLGMHLPIKTDFLSQLGSSAVTDVLSEEDADSAKRFAHSTAIAFTGAGNTVAVARGDIRSPHASSLRQFLEEFQALGSGSHWAVEPVMDPAKIQAFLDSNGAVEFGTTFSTAKELFDGDAVGPISFAEGMANQVGSDLEVEVVVRLANGKGSQETRSKLKNLLAADLGILARNKRSKTRAKVEADGVFLDLDLVASRMQREFEIQPSQTESALFSDLLKGVATVGTEEQTGLMRMIDGE